LGEKEIISLWNQKSPRFNNKNHFGLLLDIFINNTGKTQFMKCDSCKKEDQWLEMIGQDFICHKCVNKNKIMGLILRTHIDTFRFVLRKTKAVDYKEFMGIDRKLIESLVDLKKYGIFLKTTNVVELD
jgi:hypothetical protein